MYSFSLVYRGISLSPVISRQYPVARELSNNWIPRAKNLQIAFWIFPRARLAVVLGQPRPAAQYDRYWDMPGTIQI